MTPATSAEEQVHTPAAVKRRAKGERAKASEVIERYALPMVWLAVIVLFTLLHPHSFLTTQNFATIFGSQAAIAVLALGLLIPLTTGDFDVSIAFVLNLSAMLVAVLNVNEHWPIVYAILAALAVGGVIGLLNGAFVTIFAIDSFIVTLGMGTFIGGVILWISSSNTISGISSHLVTPVITTKFLGIPLEFYYALALCVLIWYVFEFTPLGRRLLIVGRSRNVARLSGLRVNRLRCGALVASGIVSALAGVLYAGTTGSADPTSGSQLLLPAFAAAFLGATTIMPGRFNPWGTVIAVFFLLTGINGLQLSGVQGYVQDLFYGAALVLAVTLSQIARKREALNTGAGS